MTSILPNDNAKVLLLPTGMGETKIVATPNFHYHDAKFVSDGRRLLVLASESNRPRRFWLQDIAGGPPHAVTPEGLDGILVTLNHNDFVSVRDDQGKVRLYPIDGGEPKIVKGLTDSDLVVGGAPTSNNLFVTPDSSNIPMQVFKVDTTTGLRRLFVTLSPHEPAGVVDLFHPIFTPDEKRYVFGQVRIFSVLYVATGLK